MFIIFTGPSEPYTIIFVQEEIDEHVLPSSIRLHHLKYYLVMIKSRISRILTNFFLHWIES